MDDDALLGLYYAWKRWDGVRDWETFVRITCYLTVRSKMIEAIRRHTTIDRYLSEVVFGEEITLEMTLPDTSPSAEDEVVALEAVRERVARGERPVATKRPTVRVGNLCRYCLERFPAIDMGPHHMVCPKRDNNFRIPAKVT